MQTFLVNKNYGLLDSGSSMDGRGKSRNRILSRYSPKCAADRLLPAYYLSFAKIAAHQGFVRVLTPMIPNSSNQLYCTRTAPITNRVLSSS
jgi:hypothetical protein